MSDAFRLLFEASPHPYLVLQPNSAFTIEAVNDLYLAATGTKRGTIVGQGMFDIFPDNPADPEATGVSDLQTSLGRVLRERVQDVMGVQRQDIRVENAAGFEERYWSRINSPVFGKDGAVAYIIHHIEDVTEFILSLRRDLPEAPTAIETVSERKDRMQAEIVLRASEMKETNRQLKAAKDVLERREAEIAALNENKFRSLANAIPHLVWIGRADGHVTWYNRRWFEYTGATQEQMEGWGWRSVHPDALPAVMRRWQDSLATGQPFDMTFPLLGADGRFRPFLTRVMPVLGSDGRVLQWFGANTDMSEQKEMEEALREAKREADRASRAKSQLLASASHDLRQPVQALVLLIGLAEGQVASLPRAVRTIGMMKAALNGLNTLLSATLEISRLDAGAVTPEKTSVDLGALLQRLAVEFAPIAGDKGLRLRASRRELHSQTDAALLERALRKLIENALRYTSKGGVLLGLRRRGADVRIDVVDTGVGVPRDKQAEIFEEFLQLHNPGRDVGEGLGLGLAIVDRLARLLGARVELSSQVGRGSRFSLSLALEPAVAAVKAIEPAQAHLGGRVLIVEDNVQLRFGLEASLQEWGYQTFTADSGEHALDVAAEEHWRLDMIVADYRLGVGLTGPATAQEIVRRAGRPFPVLVLTGDTAKERIAEIQSSGFALLHKPVAIDDLRREMMRLAHA